MLHLEVVLEQFSDQPLAHELSSERARMINCLSEVFSIVPGALPLFSLTRSTAQPDQQPLDKATANAVLYVQSPQSLAEQFQVAGFALPLMAQELSERARDFMDDGKFRDPTPLQRKQTALAPTNTDEMEGFFGGFDSRLRANPSEDPRQASIHLQVRFNCHRSECVHSK